MTKTKKGAGRILALLLSVMMIIGMLPTTAVAAGTTESAADAVVTLTVSNKGVLATANDGSVMANREVTVKDMNSDGCLTFDEALIAAHAEYNSETGYSGGTYVSKLWGVETSNCLFFVNDVGLSESVDSYTVKDGDRLVASINADDTYYADWYSAFDSASETVTVGQPITLTLKGHLGMANTEEEMTDVALSGISVGTTSGGSFTAIEGKATDSDGKVTLSFDTAGTYYVTASGTVEDTVTDWDLIDMNGSNYGVMVDWNTGEASMAYTEKDYGNGPYPEDEVQWVDFWTWVENPDSYHTLHSNLLIADCPIIAPVCVVTVEKAESTANFEEIYKDTGDYLASLGVPGVGSTGGEWIVIGLARSDREVADGYYEAVLQFVKKEINDAEQLHRAKSTENSRIILALTALGMDVTDVGGHNLLQGLTDMDYVTWQGINGPIWALIAFDSAGYEIPSALEGTDPVSREKLIDYILNNQFEDGGWALSGSTADPDITGMAVQALAAYYNDEHPEVKAAVAKALACLSEIQRDDGGFASWGTVNAESCAQVIVALTALGINPDSDPRFIKNDCSVLDALLAFAVDGGGFKHTATGNVNGMATEQGYYALVAYDRFLNGKTSLYDMSDVIGGTEEPPVTDYEDVYKATGDYLASLGTSGVGSTGGEWQVLGLARSGREVSDEYYSAVIKFVRENVNEKEQLDAAKSTENVRVILALTSLGFDVTDVDGHDLLQGLTDMGYVTKQGINGPIFALIAFDSGKYEIPTAPAGADQVTREKLVNYILQTQLNDGGWALGGNEADPDMTAIALQALAPYYGSSDVKTAVDEALDCLSVIQQPDGGYKSVGIANAESCAQVVVALTALGIDPDSDARFIKNGNSVLDALLTFAMAEGGFKHTTTSSLVNGTATEQGYYALVAYDRFLKGKTSLYDMSDVKGETEEPPVPEDKDITLTDVEGTGVTVTGKESILSGLELEAELLTSGELYDKVKEALKDGQFTLYDLYLLENNLEVQPDGTITVSIPVPADYDGAKCKVYRVNADGSVTEITAALQDGKLMFETDQIGAFAVYQSVTVDIGDPDGNGNGTTTNPGDGNNDSTTDVSQTGDSSHVVLWFTVSLLSLAAMAVLRKRKTAVK